MFAYMRKLANQELERLSVSEFREAGKTPVILVLDDIRSGLNVGSIFRTADAFLLQAIYICGITACPPNKEIQKTALGATDTVAWKYFEKVEEALTDLKENNIPIYAVEQIENSQSLENFQPDPEKVQALIFGNEVFGVSQQALPYCDGAIEIPQRGSKHSLNVAVSAGIVVWDIFSKINADA